MVPFIPRRGSPSSSPALFCRAGAAAWNAPQQLHPVVPGAQDAGWAAPGTWVPSGWAEFRPRGCSRIPRLLPEPRRRVLSPFLRAQGALCPFSGCRFLSWLENGAPSPFCGRRVLPDPFFQAQGASGSEGAQPLARAQACSVPFPVLPHPRQTAGPFPSAAFPPSASRLSACEKSFIGLFDVVEPRTGETFIKALPRGPGDYEY